MFANNDFLKRWLQFRHREFQTPLSLEMAGKCAASLLATYTTYRGWIHVKNRRSIPRIEVDAEGLRNKVVSTQQVLFSFSLLLMVLALRLTSH